MTAALVTCPATHHPTGSVRVFLAGGITGCPDWQTVAAGWLPDHAVAYNPRQTAWPIDDPGASAGQIRWEVERLAQADLVLFWFCAETVQPIALYELGAAAATSRPILVGAHPGYPRRLDVVLQLSHARPELTVHSTLMSLCAAATEWVAGRGG